MPNEMLVESAYAGNAGVKLLAQAQLDQLPDQYLALGDDVEQSVTNPFFGIIPVHQQHRHSAPPPAGQLLRPYPQLTDSQTWGSFAHSSYHSLR